MDLPGTGRRTVGIVDGKLAFALTFIAFLVPVWGYTATTSVTWMRMLDLDSFRSAADVWSYLVNLRTGIPPVLSALELLWWVQFRDLTLFSVILYPITIALAFTLALVLQPVRPLHRAALVLVGVFLANRGAEVHAGNPANYDPLFAFLLLGYFLLIGTWERGRRPVWLAAAGLSLSLLELTRPFMIFLLPLFLLVEWHRIHLNAHRRRLAVAAFLLPVVALSGGWHMHLFLAHDHQIAWTNISGYNLQRAWEDLDPEIRAVQHLDQLPRNGALWADLNTTEIYMRSEELKRMIVGKIRENPAGAAAHVMNRLATFVSSPTEMYGHNPQGLDIEVYRKLVSALVLLLPFYVVVSAVSLLRRRRWPWLERRWWLAASTLLIALLVTLGEQGEEGRFLFTILPMLLAVAGFVIDDLTRRVRAGERRAACDKGAPACDWY
jgi:4-amino-4-deoxy-L-arabinose transferase-like glycosyltransferase